MAGSEDTGDEPVPPAPILQSRQAEADFSRHRLESGAAVASLPAQDPASSSVSAAGDALHHDHDQNEFLMTTTELAENVPVPKSRPLGRRVSSRRLIMSSSLSSAGGLFPSSRTAVSRSSSGTSTATGTKRRGSVILAQLRAAAGSIQGANDSDDENEDRLIEMAVNAVMAEPDNTEARILGVSRAVSGASVNSRVSRASSVRSKEPSQLESRLSGVSLKPAPGSSTAAKAVPPTAMELHESSSGDSASSFAKEALLLASNFSSDKSPTPKETEYMPLGDGEAERPGLGERQPSWMRDALEQMSAGDVQAFLNDSHATMGEAAIQAIHSASSASLNQNHLLVDGFENTEVLEQYRIIAHHEARQRVKENLGYDPVERKEEERLNSKKGSTSDSASDSGGRKESLVNEVTLPPMYSPTIIPVAPVGVCLPKESLPKSRSLAPTATPRQPELCEGKVVPGTSGSSSNHSLVDSSREIVVRCLGCRSHLQVPIHATLVHCPQCSTISPATSTR